MAERKTIVVSVVALAILMGGSIAGAVLLGGIGNAADQSGAQDGSNAAGSAPTPTATAVSTDESANETDNSTVTPTGTPMSPQTSSPTATMTPTPTVTAAPDDERTPILVRRFDEAEIERALREMLNDWREDQGLQPFTNPNGTVSIALGEMAANHSAGMADRGELVHEIDGNESVDRYEIHELRTTCRFKKSGAQYIVTPERNRFEVLAHTYAGREYEGPNGTQFNENETQVAADIFESWIDNRAHRDRLSYENANRIGIGIEISQTNEVYATGNVCGVGQSGS